MAPVNPTTKPRRRLLPGTDWLMVAVGILALAGSLFMFVDSDAPQLSNTEANKPYTS